jgi:hypothetical protein
MKRAIGIAALATVLVGATVTAAYAGVTDSPAAPSRLVTIQTKVQRFTPPNPGIGIGEAFATTPTCTAPKHAVNGGVQQTRAVANTSLANPGTAFLDPGSEKSTVQNVMLGVPRPVNNDTAWRVQVRIGWPSASNSGPFNIPLDITFFTVCV